MKIHFDYQAFHSQRFGGISNYFSQLFYRFDQMPEVVYDLSLRFSDNEHLGSNHSFFNKRLLPDRAFGVLNRVDSMGSLAKKNYDIFHPTYYNSYFLKTIGSKPFVVTVHDMTHEKFPGLFPGDRSPEMKRIVCEKATRIIAISENTKLDLMEFLKIPEEKIDVIYHGGNHIHRTTEAISESFLSKIPSQFLLYVGSRMNYKNFRPFVEASIPILKKNPELKILCTGKPFSKEEIDFFEKKNISSNQIQHLFPNQPELNVLYQKAAAFVFPSLYEGFGIPILEAFQNDCPVILSDASCFPEIAGDAAVYFNPKSLEEMRTAIESVIETNDRSQQLIENGKKRQKQFSWEKATKETISSYEKLLS